MPTRSSIRPPGSTPAAQRGDGNRSDKRGKGRQEHDVNVTAFGVFQQAVGEAEKQTPEPKPEKNPAAVTLGRLGGLKGGKARASKLTPEKRAEIAKKAAEKRWAEKS